MSNTLIVYRSGGLGDFVKTWPVLRNNHNITVVTSTDRGGLAEALLGTTYRDVKQWKPCFDDAAGPPDYADQYNNIIVYRHVCYNNNNNDDQLIKRIKSIAENSDIEFRDYSPSNCSGIKPKKADAGIKGPVFHVGAGRLIFGKNKVPSQYPAKAWDISRSLDFASKMKTKYANLSIMAGPDQLHAWDHIDERRFISAGGIFCNNLYELACRILVSQFFIGFDSGPTHLATQLGKPTIALFGPTGLWGTSSDHDLVHAEPLGENVEIIYPDRSVPDDLKARLKWLDPENAVDRVIEAYSKLQNK